MHCQLNSQSSDIYQTTEKKPRQVSLLTTALTEYISRSPNFMNSGDSNSSKKDQQSLSADLIKIKVTINDTIYNLKLRPSDRNSIL